MLLLIGWLRILIQKWAVFHTFQYIRQGVKNPEPLPYSNHNDTVELLAIGET